jgi:hypothetical protein
LELVAGILLTTAVPVDIFLRGEATVGASY